jgi:isoquinoline 1-oxidoreductase beta subunit
MSSFDDLRQTVRSDDHTRWWPDRRQMLIGGGAGVGLLLAWAAWPKDTQPGINANPGETIFAPFLKIGRDGHVTVLCPQAELGQGAYTAIAQIAADELGADWRAIAVEPAPAADIYANSLFFAEDSAQAIPRFGVPIEVETWSGWRSVDLPDAPPAMVTGGSTTVRMFEEPVREAAATARSLLCMAGAARWNVEWETCFTRDGFVINGNRRLRFGELAEAAALETPPAIPPRRAPDDESLAGRPLPRLDLPAKVDGSFGFAGDVRLPDLAFAAIRQGPHGDTRLLRYNRAAGDRVRGFLGAVKHERWLAAVATNSWAASRALDAMAPVFRTTGTLASSTVSERRLRAAADGFAGTRVVVEGDAREAMRGRIAISADFLVAPALPAAIETRTATAQPDGSRMRVWVATQAPGYCRSAIAKALGVSPSSIVLLPMPGGGPSGMAFEHDVAVQAALIACAMNRPVQLCWSRTEQILRDLPRAPARARMQATLSAGATIDAWQAAIATPAARHEGLARLHGAKAGAAQASAAGNSDAGAIRGARPPYRIPHLAIDHLPVDSQLPAGQGRAGSDSFTTFFTECFIDELATLSGVDPLNFRMGMLTHAPRLARCLQTATAIGGWTGGATGSAEGIACASLRGSHIAVMAKARRSERGLVVERMIAAVDCGRVINPNIVRQQIEGGMIAGLAIAIGATTRYARGLARARRLSEINLPILAQTPQITVELIVSEADPGGVSEIGLPPVAPAIANALFTSTGRRLRRLPLNEMPIA